MLPVLASYIVYIYRDNKKNIRSIIKRLFWYGSPVIVAGLILLGYSFIRYGDIFETGYFAFSRTPYLGRTDIFNSSVLLYLERVYSLILGPAKG